MTVGKKSWGSGSLRCDMDEWSWGKVCGRLGGGLCEGVGER